jgi:hypothetical protein
MGDRRQNLRELEKRLQGKARNYGSHGGVSAEIMQHGGPH